MGSTVLLSRDGVVDEAIALTRLDGLAGVTMRALATRLGVTPMALYRHIADRDELIRLVADRIGSLVQPDVDPGAGWEQQVRAWATTQREVLRAHPGLAAWLMDNGPAGPQAYRLLELLASALAAGGFDDARVARGTALVMSWTFSRVAIEDNADTRARTGRAGRAGAFVAGLETLDPADHPTAARIGTDFFTLPVEEVFEEGLECIIAGFRPDQGSPGDTAVTEPR
ncbi:TetR/AcrR family transcriptional regulator [Nitriliruptor alkaliphilus]|uniref:TetR/AcrR family transcriptional regulator n=1 Tax=Nitriliruptor alkaliphilus TaxID=427918 RepID=UPI000695E585|nr:TetR/AcrR family transcriptional regulator [Nitriliruptor alkaliphilus]